MCKPVILFSVLFIFLSCSCQKSQFSTVTRHSRNGKVSYTNHFPRERTTLADVKPPPMSSAPLDPQNITLHQADIIASSSNEPTLMEVHENRVGSTPEPVLFPCNQNRSLTQDSGKDSVTAAERLKNMTKNFSKPAIMKQKNGRKDLVLIISLSGDSLVYQYIREHNVTRTVMMDQFDTILPDTRKTEPLGVIGFVASTLSFFPVIFAAPYIGIPLAALGVVFGAISLHRIRRNQATYKGHGFGYAAMILGIIGFVTMIIICIAWLVNSCTSVTIYI